MSNEAPGRGFFFPPVAVGHVVFAMLLLWSKETSRNMTKFVYGQYSFTGLGDYFTVESCSKGIPCMGGSVGCHEALPGTRVHNKLWPPSWHSAGTPPRLI